jgi:hypothetical protein
MRVRIVALRRSRARCSRVRGPRRVGHRRSGSRSSRRHPECYAATRPGAGTHSGGLRRRPPLVIEAQADLDALREVEQLCHLAIRGHGQRRPHSARRSRRPRRVGDLNITTNCSLPTCEADALRARLEPLTGRVAIAATTTAEPASSRERASDCAFHAPSACAFSHVRSATALRPDRWAGVHGDTAVTAPANPQ